MLCFRFSVLIPVILLAAAATGSSVHAGLAEAICVDDPRDAFARAVHEHIKAYQSLIATRGIAAEAGDVPNAKDIDVDDVLSFIDADLGHLATSSSGRPVIAFYAQDAEQTCGFLLSAGQPLLYSRQRLAPPALSELVDNWRRSLAIEQLVASRAPRKRAAESGMDDAVMTGPSELETRARLSSALMPAVFAAAIPTDAELIVVPTNDIGTLPFALLDLPSGQRLVERAAVTIAANLWEALLIERDDLLQAARGLAAADGGWSAEMAPRIGVAPGWPKAMLVGDPDATHDPEWIFPRLPGARNEVEEIGGFLAADPLSGPAGETLTGEGATREAVLEAMADAPSLIYFAAHGVADVEEPLDGFIALSGGRLTARDAQSTMTGASLVVLSACQTGLGQAHAGGVIGLARGFQLGGAIAVVMSLWSVDDEATRLLMTHFMRRVGHVSPSQALREAMLNLRQTHSDPLLWGSFQVFGSLMPAAR